MKVIVNDDTIKVINALAGSGFDTNAIHLGTAAEISTLTEKENPANDDLIVIEDSAASNGKKKVKLLNLSGSGDMTKEVYDTGDVEGDVFDMDNMVEGDTTKILTDTERSIIAEAVRESDYNANTILAATTDDTPAPLEVTASTFVGRKAAGNISAMSVTEAYALLIGSIPYDLPFAISDETTDLTTGTKFTYYLPRAMTLSSVEGSVVTAPTGDTLIIDVHYNGTTIFSSTKLVTALTEFTSTQSGLAITSLAKGGKIEVIVDQIGSTVAGAGAKVSLMGVVT